MTIHENRWCGRPVKSKVAAPRFPTKRIYICSPLKGSIEKNMERAIKYCRFAFDEGFVPIAPHAYFTGFLDDHDPAERELGVSAGIELLTGCDPLWYFGERVTEGMAREINMAKNLGIPVSHIDSEEINLSKNNQNFMEVAL